MKKQLGNNCHPQNPLRKSGKDRVFPGPFWHQSAHCWAKLVILGRSSSMLWRPTWPHLVEWGAKKWFYARDSSPWSKLRCNQQKTVDMVFLTWYLIIFDVYVYIYTHIWGYTLGLSKHLRKNNEQKLYSLRLSFFPITTWPRIGASAIFGQSRIFPSAAGG